MKNCGKSLKVAAGPYLSTNRSLKQIITTNYTKTAIFQPLAFRHLKVRREGFYTKICHRMDLFLSRSNYVNNNMARDRREAL